jgi:adenylate cyclase class IV
MDGKKTELGNFIEIRSTNKDADKDKIEAVLRKLGLDIKDGIKESYFEM